MYTSKAMGETILDKKKGEVYGVLILSARRDMKPKEDSITETGFGLTKKEKDLAFLAG